jgi:hypothetical protein
MRPCLRQFRVDLLGLVALDCACATELSGGSVKQRVDPAAQLVGRLRALKTRQRLARGQRHHRRHRLDTEDLSHPRRRVDVHVGQRPLARVGGGEARKRVAQLHTGIAPWRPQHHDDRNLVGLEKDLGLEISLGDLHARGRA